MTKVVIDLVVIVYRQVLCCLSHHSADQHVKLNV